jgi:ATP-dependent DNA helicase RecG
MARTSNGFEIAETDLLLRGPGEFFGTRQSGDLGFHIANPLRDREAFALAADSGQQDAMQRRYHLARIG